MRCACVDCGGGGLSWDGVVADHSRQSLQRADVRGDGEVDLLDAEARVLGADTNVARDGHVDAPAEARALYRAHDGRAAPLERGEAVLEAADVAVQRLGSATGARRGVDPAEPTWRVGCGEGSPSVFRRFFKIVPRYSQIFKKLLK